MTEHNASTHEPVRTMTSHSLKALEQLLANRMRTEFPNQLLIIDRQQLSGFIDTTRNVKGGYDLFDGLGLGGFVGETQRGERGGLTRFVGHCDRRESKEGVD